MTRLREPGIPRIRQGTVVHPPELRGDTAWEVEYPDEWEWDCCRWTAHTWFGCWDDAVTFALATRLGDDSMRHVIRYLTMMVALAVVGLVVWRVIISADPVISALLIVGSAMVAGFVVWVSGETKDHCQHLEELEERVEELEIRERTRRNAILN